MAYTTAGAVRSYAGIDTTGDDTLVTALIARAQTAIETYTGHVFEATSGTRYYHALEDVEDRTLYLDDDLISVTTLTNLADSAGAAETWGSTEYVLLPYNETPKFAIALKDNSDEEFDYSETPEKAISVQGSWGFSNTPPADIVHATIRLATYYYRQKDADVFDVTAIPDAGIIQVPQGMPKDVKIILDNPKYRKRTVGAV